MAYGVKPRDPKPEPIVTSQEVCATTERGGPPLTTPEFVTLRALAEILARLERIEARLDGGGA